MTDYYHPGLVDDLLPIMLEREENVSLEITVIDEINIPEKRANYDVDEDLLEDGDVIYLNEVPDWFKCEFKLKGAVNEKHCGVRE